jgi:hypothetical protein
MRWIALITVMLGCEAVAGVDLHYTGGMTGPDSGHPSSDGATPDPDADAFGPGGLCGCDFTGGEGCCLPHGGTPFCTSDSYGCIGTQGLFIGCDQSQTDFVCCWTSTNGGGGGSQTAANSTCKTGPLYCNVTADCNGTTCQLATCAGITIGACGMTPACP